MVVSRPWPGVWSHWGKRIDLTSASCQRLKKHLCGWVEKLPHGIFCSGWHQLDRENLSIRMASMNLAECNPGTGMASARVSAFDNVPSQTTHFGFWSGPCFVLKHLSSDLGLLWWMGGACRPLPGDPVWSLPDSLQEAALMLFFYLLNIVKRTLANSQRWQDLALVFILHLELVVSIQGRSS